MQTPQAAYRTVTWREGTNTALSSRFAAVRVRPAHRDYWSSSVRAEEWLLIEWPEGDVEPLKYFMSTAPENATLEQLVFVTKMRWRIERDYQDLKQEFGLGHYEGRGWRGFHHHASLSIAAYGFLMAQRLGIGSHGDGKKNGAKLSLPVFPSDYIPRGSPARATPCS
jgi:SRSO17 transposase